MIHDRTKEVLETLNSSKVSRLATEGTLYSFSNICI